jgi:hypothetical protein
MTTVRNEGRKPNIALQVVDTETGQCTYKTPANEVQIFNSSDPEATLQLAKWLSGEDDRLIQDSCPLLSVSQRELCLSGLDDGQWDDLTDLEDDDLERDAGRELTEAERAESYGNDDAGEPSVAIDPVDDDVKG